MSDQNELEILKKRIAELESKVKSDSAGADKDSEDSDTPLKTIYKWKAPNRIVVARSKQWYATASIIASLIILFAIIFGNWILILVVISFAFLIYVLDTVPPEIINLEITNKGIKVAEKFHLWKDIDYFWVSERNGNKMINLELKEFQGRVYLLIGEGDLNKILTEMLKHEDYREPKGFDGLISRLTDGPQKKITELSPKK